MQNFIDACIKANKEIYEYITTHISSEDYKYTNTIGAGGDKSLQIDVLCENIFIKHLSIFGDIHSEEIGLVKNQNSSYIITIDPLDGSDNFITNIPYYGTSVAIEHENKVLASCVCNLSNQDLIYKVNNEVKRVKLYSLKDQKFTDHKNTKIGIFERAYRRSDICSKLFEQKMKYRSMGAIALSLCTAHTCEFVMFSGEVRSFDVKAALHICEDLHISISKDFLIVTKSLKTMQLIKDIIKEK